MKGVACGFGAAGSHFSAAASHGWSGPAPRIMDGRGRVCCPHPSSWMSAYCCVGASSAHVAAHHRPHSRAHSAPTIRASHAGMEPRPRIHGGKRASCRCFEKPPGRSRYGWGFSCARQSRVPFATWREPQNPCRGAGEGGGGQLPSVPVSHRCNRAAALRGPGRSCSSR